MVVTLGQQYNTGEKPTVIMLLLLLFLTFSVLVANPKKLLYTVANPARGLLNREKRTKEKVWQHTPPHTARSEKNKNHASHLQQALHRSRSFSRPYKDTFGSSTRPMGVTSQNSTHIYMNRHAGTATDKKAKQKQF